jgi:hypothetical protein
MSLVEDGRPSSKTSLSTCRKSRYSSRSDTTTIMPDRRRPPSTAAQQRARRSGTPQGTPFFPTARSGAGSCDVTATATGDALTVIHWILQLVAWALAA